MSYLSKLGVSTLKTKSGDADLSSLKDKTVLIYFSAHWCPPCKGFTPELAKYYNKYKDEKNFEIIFVSSDKDQAAFDGYYGEQPWLALPFEERELKNKLSSKFGVSGIPTLVVLEANTHTLITDKGRAKVDEDPNCEKFPWKPKSLSEIMNGLTVVGKDGAKKSFADLDADVVGIYFSAHWCPPCKAFTPELVKTYNKLKSRGEKFEIIFASSDRDEAQFNEYFEEMPWLALPYADRAKKEELSGVFDVSGIPAFMIINKSDFSIISKDGRSAVGGDPEGTDFPWHPKPLNDLSGGFGAINELPSLVAFCAVDNEDEKKKTVETMKSVAGTHWEEQKASGEDPEFAFFTGSKQGDGNSSRIRGLFKLDEKSVQVCMVDIPGGGNGYISTMKEVTPESIKDFMKNYKSLEKIKLF